MKPKHLIIIGGVLLVIGSLLPWFNPQLQLTPSSPTFDSAKLGGIGILMTAAGVLITVLGLKAKVISGTRGSMLACVAGFVIALFSINYLYQLTLGIPLSAGDASVGSGIYICVIGALVTLIGGFIRNPTSTDSHLSLN